MKSKVVAVSTRFIISLLAVSTAVVACKKNDDNSAPTAGVAFHCDEGSKPSVEGIIHGKEMSSQSMFAKPIVLIAQWSNESKTSGSLCTGTLIDNDIVLTAAHCIDEAKEDSDVEVFFTADTVCDKNRSTLDSRPAIGLGFHRDFMKGGELVNDIALIRFEGGIPQNKALVELAPNAKMSPDSQILVAGFGKTKGYKKTEEKSGSRLRFGFVTPLTNKEILKDFKKSGRTEVIDSRANKVLYFDQTTQNGVCAGDSGGPAFEKQNGRWLQIGIASFVANTDKTEGAEACAQVSAHTDLTLFSDWIREAKKALRAPSKTN